MNGGELSNNADDVVADDCRLHVVVRVAAASVRIDGHGDVRKASGGNLVHTTLETAGRTARVARATVISH